MGCSASKNVAVVPLDTSQGSNGVANKNRSAHKLKSAPRDVDLQPGELENAVVNNVQKAGNGMSFEITFDENDPTNESVIQKHPPKRILELQESENKPPVTLEKLQEKMEEAEIRRQQILQQRTQSANLLKRSKNTETLQSVDGEFEDQRSPNHLTVPPVEGSPRPSNPH